MNAFVLCLVMVMAVAYVQSTSEPHPTPLLMRRCRRPPQIKGPEGQLFCRAAIPMWHWNDVSRQCVDFQYSGCNGTDNRFPTKEKCQETCGLMRKVPPCPAPGLIEQKPGCVPYSILEPKAGCGETVLNCPTVAPTGPCAVTRSMVKPPNDCELIELKGPNGCPYPVADCTKGPQTQDP